MNKKGEMEIALNKRTIERACFVLVIIVFAALYFLKDGSDPALASNATELEEHLAEQKAMIDDLKEDIASRDAILEIEEAEPEPEPVAEGPALSGRIIYDWEIDGDSMLATEYNAEEIAVLQARLAELEEQYDDAEGSGRDNLRDRIDETEDELGGLQFADAKYQLNEVSVIVDNGLPEDKTLEYELCWETIECIKVKAKGTIVVPSGTVYDEPVPLDIPTLIFLSRSQTLQLKILEDGEEVFIEERVIEAIR